MIASVFVLLFTAAIASASFHGVDPNTLSCDPLGQIFLLLPHFTECNKFYMCTHGKEVEFTCAAGTIFDFEIQVCNHPYATKCWLRDAVEGSGDPDEIPEVEGSGDPVLLADVASPIATIQVGEAVLNCNTKETASRQIPYKDDCQRYWRCINGAPAAVYCTDGLFFNSVTEQCDFEANAKCLVTEHDELTGEYMLA